MSNNTEHDDLLAKWLAGTLSDAELELLKETTDLDELSQTLNAVDQLEPPAFSPEASWVSFEQKLTKEEAVVRSISRRTYMLAAAAVAAVLIGLFFFMNSASTVQFQVAAGDKGTYELPDGSKVELQGPSSIEYNQEDYQISRHLSLDGVAYFDVIEGNEFIVHHLNGSVEVLGTTFDVDTREGLKVFCYTGKVGVNTPKVEQIILEKGNGVQIATDGQVELTTSKMMQPQWLDGLIHMTNAEMEEIGQILEELFEVEVELVGEISKVYHGPIDPINLDQNLDMIKTTLQLEINKIGTDTIRISAK